MLILFCLLMFVMLESARRERRSVVALEYQYRMFALRDELRKHVIANPSLAKSWVFAFLDSTLTKLVRVLPDMSFWTITGLMLTYRNSDPMRRLRGHLEREYNKTQNAKFQEIESRLMETIGEYIDSKHALMFKVLHFLLFKLLTNLLMGVQKLRKDSLEVVVEAPETSTLCEHCAA